MIYFSCPECGDDLEADDDIKGTRMKCPSCWNEIEVPVVGVKLEKRSPRSAHHRRSFDQHDDLSSPLSVRLILLMLVVGVVMIGGLFGLGLYLKSQQPVDNRPTCSVCDGKGKLICHACKGSRTAACSECKATGQITNFRGEKETCQSCGGSGTIMCRVCNGQGYYSCVTCMGEGRVEPGSSSPMPSFPQD